MRAGTTIVPRFVTREQWGAASPTRVHLQKLPIEQVWFSYNIGETTCVGDDQCFPVLRQYQKDFMAKGLSDIPYNFLVGGDGTVYEGRGWHRKPSSTLGPNYTSKVNIAFIGDFERKTLPKEMYFKALDLLCHGVRENYLLRAHSFNDTHRRAKVSAMINLERLEDRLKDRTT